MSKLNENQILWITIVVALLTVGGVGFLDWWLWEKDYKVKVEKRDRLNADILALEQKKVELAQFRTEIAKLQTKEAEYGEILPSPEEVTRGEFLSMLSGFERQAQVLVSNVTQVQAAAAPPVGPGAPGAARPAQLPFEAVEFKFTVKGGFFEVVHFMYLIENHKRIMKIGEGDINPDQARSLIATPGGEAPQKIPVILNVKVATYVYTAPKDAPKTPGPGGGGS